jgi:hypothetical protein
VCRENTNGAFNGHKKAVDNAYISPNSLSANEKWKEEGKP